MLEPVIGPEFTGVVGLCGSPPRAGMTIAAPEMTVAAPAAGSLVGSRAKHQPCKPGAHKGQRHRVVAHLRLQIVKAHGAVGMPKVMRHLIHKLAGRQPLAQPVGRVSHLFANVLGMAFDIGRRSHLVHVTCSRATSRSFRT